MMQLLERFFPMNDIETTIENRKTQKPCLSSGNRGRNVPPPPSFLTSIENSLAFWKTRHLLYYMEYFNLSTNRRGKPEK